MNDQHLDFEDQPQDADLDLFSDELEDRFNAGSVSTTGTLSSLMCISTASSACTVF